MQLWKSNRYISSRGRIHAWSVITDDFSWLHSFSPFLRRIIDARSIILASHSLDRWLYSLVGRRHAQWVSSVPSSIYAYIYIYLPGLFMRGYLFLLQRPNAALVRLPAKHAGNLVTASSCRTSRPSRLTGARTWRWVHFSLKAFPIPPDLSILRLFRSLPCAHATLS